MVANNSVGAPASGLRIPESENAPSCFQLGWYRAVDRKATIWADGDGGKQGSIGNQQFDGGFQLLVIDWLKHGTPELPIGG